MFGVQWWGAYPYVEELHDGGGGVVYFSGDHRVFVGCVSCRLQGITKTSTVAVAAMRSVAPTLGILKCGGGSSRDERVGMTRAYIWNASVKLRELPCPP